MCLVFEISGLKAAGAVQLHKACGGFVRFTLLVACRIARSEKKKKIAS